MIALKKAEFYPCVAIDVDISVKKRKYKLAARFGINWNPMIYQFVIFLSPQERIFLVPRSITNG